LQQLADNAVAERRFDDAAHGYHKLAMEAMQVGWRALSWQQHGMQ
jgi:hypothetical protein